MRTLILAIALLSLAQTVAAQLIPASPPIADPADARFKGVKEDWTSPALSSSNLRPAPPVTGYINDYPGYTVELLQVQWRFREPPRLYLMIPPPGHKPPALLPLLSFPSTPHPLLPVT